MIVTTNAAVMIHVSDVKKGLAWYAEAFPEAQRTCDAECDFEYLSVGDVHIEIVPSDEKVKAGAAGSVVYWHVDRLQSAIGHFVQLGALCIVGHWRSAMVWEFARFGIRGATALAYAGSILDLWHAFSDSIDQGGALAKQGITGR